MPYHLVVLSSGSDMSQKKAYVINTQTGKHFSNKPIPVEKAKAQMRLLQSLELRNK